MFNLKFNVMKKIVFSLMTLFALALMAGSAFAQTATTPYVGVTYTYTLGGIEVQNNSEAVVTYSGAGATITSTPIALTSASTQLSFDVVYSDGTIGGAGNLTVTITDGTTNCSNYINLAIVPTPAPTLELAVTASVVDLCQNLNGTPADNTAADIGAADNTFTFTITPTTTGTLNSGDTYSFDFDLNDYLIGATAITITHTASSATATPVGPVGSQIVITDAPYDEAQEFTVTFATTTGLPNEIINGEASSGELQVGGTVPATYTATYNPSNVDVTVKSTPAIGVFTY